MKKSKGMDTNQISFFDTDFNLFMVSEKAFEIVKEEESIAERLESFDMKMSEISEKIEDIERKTFVSSGPRNDEIPLNTNQLNTVSKLRENYNITRIIKLLGNGLEVEVLEDGEFKTHYVNSEGVLEFTFNRVAKVFPEETILECSIPQNELTERQISMTEKIKDSLGKPLRVIHRHGDKNIILEYPSKDKFNALCITSEGKSYEFKNINRIKCSKEDVMEETTFENLDREPTINYEVTSVNLDEEPKIKNEVTSVNLDEEPKIKNEETLVNLDEEPKIKNEETSQAESIIKQISDEEDTLKLMQKSLKVGDRVRAPFIDEDGNHITIEGLLTHCYNGDLTFNILFDGGKRSTAVCRYIITEKIS